MNAFFYIIVSLLFTNIVLAVIFFTAYFSMGRERHTLIWAFTFVVAACQWLVNIFQPSNFNAYWMIACTLSVGTILFGTWGHLVRTNSRFSKTSLLLSGLAIIAITYYFTVIDLHRGLSTSLYIYHTVFYLLLCGYVLLKHRDKPRAAEIGAAAAYILFAISQGIAATYALMQGAEWNAEYFDIYRMINFVSLPTGYIGMSLFIVFVLASDMSEKMRIQAITDSLTTCLNRRGFFQIAQDKLLSLLKKEMHVCLVYWDIDKFKAINDNFGHSAGDMVLQRATDVIKQNIKDSDLIGRLGGEEFVILLGRVDFDDARLVAERLRVALETTSFEYNGQLIDVTASFGVVQLKGEGALIETAIDRADKALYQAKQSGRNKVVQLAL